LSGEQAARWRAFAEREVPADVLTKLLDAAEPQKGATRALASKVEQRLAELVPSLVGGSADLNASTKTDIKGGGGVARGEFGGRNVHFGIREHGMGAIMNGLALSGFFIPLGSTFLIFSDYMRPSMRLAALMGQQAVYVFTHDSVFLGEDGPTHQPVEQVTSLRLIPNLDVVRPADALECAAAWAHAATRRHGPTALVLSRQKLPILTRAEGFDPKQLLRGAYVLSDVDKPELVLIATGSEVGLAVEAQKVLAKRGKRARVVSAPCLEAFSRLPSAEQEAVLGKDVRRVSIEAGRTPLWRSVVGLDGITIGIDRFGASAPAERIAEELGFTPDKVADAILAQL
jgi:transketolase